MSEFAIQNTPPGSGSSIVAPAGNPDAITGITLENAGTPIAGNPHHTLNVVGAIVTDNGMGIATIDITGTGYFNVKDYGATGNGDSNDTNSIRSAVAACVTAGGGVVYFPNGTYLVSNTETEFNCIDLPSNVRLLGQSRDGATVKLAADTDGSVRIIYANGVDSSVSTITLDGNKLNQTVDEHRSGIFSDTTTRLWIENITSQNMTGDGISIFQNSNDVLIANCFVTNNNRDGISLIGGGQRGVTIQNCQCVGNAAQQIDTEPETPIFDISVTGCYLALGNNSTDYVLTISGIDRDTRSVGFLVTDNYIEGAIFCVWAEQLVFADNIVVNATANPAITVYRHCVNVIVDGNHIINTTDSTAVAAIEVVATSSLDAPQDIQIIGNIITALAPQNDGLFIAGALSTRIEGNTITGHAGIGSNFYGVEIRSTNLSLPIDWCAVRGNAISDFGVAVLAWGNGESTQIADLDVSHNVYESPNNVMHAGMSLDFDSEHVVQQCTCVGNSIIGAIEMFDTFPFPPMLIGGSRNGCGIYSCLGTPNNQLTEQVGAMAMQRDGAGGVVGWIKTSGTGNTGWQSINVT